MINLDVDDLKLYIGDDFVINDNIKVCQPTIRDIAEFGERDFFSVVHTITAIPSDMKSQLWDMELDWMEVEDFELFMMLAQTLTPDRTALLFGDLDFSKLRPFRNNQNGDVVLADKETGVIIDKMIYLRIVEYLRKAFNITPKVERAKNKITKQILIDEDRKKIEFNKNKPFKSFLLPLISSVKVRQGYTKEYVLNMGYVEFMNDVARLQVIHNADHLLSACYAGTIDMKKINKAELNWMKEL
ncbi:MAG: hypothetical protein IJ444_01910 [Kiritimatiellae bacterium]|nr:hypothetical protein [Kiritimatiellia bacterium]